MSNNQKRIQFALALLVGVFILGGTLLNMAIGEDVVHNLDVDGDGDIDVVVTLTTDTWINIEDPPPDVKAEDFVTYSMSPPTWDIKTMSGALSVSGTRIDDKGNEIGSVSVVGGVQLTINGGNVISYYWAYASSCVSLGDYIGRGNAWVHVPDKEQKNHAYGPGDFWVTGNSIYDACLNASDSNTIVETIADFFKNLGNKTMKASAALSMESVRINVKFKAEGQ